MKNKIFACLFGAVLGFTSLQTVQSDVILGWDMQGEGATVVSTSFSDSVISGIMTGATYNGLARTGLTGATAGNSFNSSAWNVSNTFSNGNDFISFRVAPSNGMVLTMTSLQYVMNGSNTGPGTGRWGYSIDGGSFILQDPTTIPFTMPSSLSSWDFDDVETEGSVEFRFWAYGSTSINGATSQAGGTVRVGNIAGNDLVLNGTVTVVPEPGSLALMGLGAFGLWSFARRRS